MRGKALGVAAGLTATLTLGAGEVSGNYFGYQAGVSAGRAEGQQSCLDTLDSDGTRELGSFTVTAAQVDEIKKDPVDSFYNQGLQELSSPNDVVLRQLQSLVPNNGSPVAVRVEVPFTDTTVSKWNTLIPHSSTYRDPGRADAAALSAFLGLTGAHVVILAPGGVQSSENYPEEPLRVVMS